VLARVLDNPGLRAEARHDRHLARERGAESVDGLDAQAVREVRAHTHKYALAHLGGRLDGERDRDDLLGLLHGLEERAVAPHQ
jgi:hypothetical protein